MKQPHTQALIVELRKQSIENSVGIWKRIAEELEGSSRKTRIVNLFAIQANAADGETVIVPGKVLGEGDITKKITVAAFAFSDEAARKINKNGKAISILDLVKSNPKGAKVRILG